MPENLDLSIVIPVYNEADNLEHLYQRLSKLAELQSLKSEFIFVDDGSSDSSFKTIERLAAIDPRVKGLSFSRNFGHMFALTAGLDASRGRAVITLDADLQHPPEVIPVLLQKWKHGAEIVNTLRIDSAGTAFFKRVTAGTFYRLMQRIARINLPQNAADFRLLDRKVVETLKTVRERGRFLRGLISWVGYKQEFVEYKAEKRLAGQTKYSLGKMIAFALDGITSFSAVPLRFATYLGLLTALISFLYMIYALYQHFFTSHTLEGWTSVMVTVLFIGGIQLIFLGVIGEYLSRVYEETKQRP